MNTWEAIKLLQEGKKIREKRWDPNKYIYKVGKNIYNENKQLCYLAIKGDEEWELYDDRKEAPQEIKDLYKAINNIKSNGILSNKTYITLLDLQSALNTLNKKYKID